MSNENARFTQEAMPAPEIQKVAWEDRWSAYPVAHRAKHLTTEHILECRVRTNQIRWTVLTPLRAICHSTLDLSLEDVEPAKQWASECLASTDLSQPPVTADIINCDFSELEERILNSIYAGKSLGQSTHVLDAALNPERICQELNIAGTVTGRFPASKPGYTMQTLDVVAAMRDAPAPARWTSRPEQIAPYRGMMRDAGHESVSTRDRAGKFWGSRELSQLTRLAAMGMPLDVLGACLGRSTPAVQAQLMKADYISGCSMRPRKLMDGFANKSLYIEKLAQGSCPTTPLVFISFSDGFAIYARGRHPEELMLTDFLPRFACLDTPKKTDDMAQLFRTLGIPMEVASARLGMTHRQYKAENSPAVVFAHGD